MTTTFCRIRPWRCSLWVAQNRQNSGLAGTASIKEHHLVVHGKQKVEDWAPKLEAVSPLMKAAQNDSLPSTHPLAEQLSMVSFSSSDETTAYIYPSMHKAPFPVSDSAESYKKLTEYFSTVDPQVTSEEIHIYVRYTTLGKLGALAYSNYRSVYTVHETADAGFLVRFSMMHCVKKSESAA